MFCYNRCQHSQLVLDVYDSPLVLALEIDCKHSQCLYVCITSMYVYVYVCITRMYVYVCITSMYVYVCIFDVCVCMYVW